jgi:hypothetical protein
MLGLNIDNRNPADSSFHLSGRCRRGTALRMNPVSLSILDAGRFSVRGSPLVPGIDALARRMIEVLGAIWRIAALRTLAHLTEWKGPAELI